MVRALKKLTARQNTRKAQRNLVYGKSKACGLTQLSLPSYEILLKLHKSSPVDLCMRICSHRGCTVWSVKQP